MRSLKRGLGYFCLGALIGFGGCSLNSGNRTAGAEKKVTFALEKDYLVRYNAIKEKYQDSKGIAFVDKSSYNLIGRMLEDINKVRVNDEQRMFFLEAIESRLDELYRVYKYYEGSQEKSACGSQRNAA